MQADVVQSICQCEKFAINNLSVVHYSKVFYGKVSDKDIVASGIREASGMQLTWPLWYGYAVIAVALWQRICNPTVLQYENRQLAYDFLT
ncbi:unnamed protein product, partial [Iphiclides podalirius]